MAFSKHRTRRDEVIDLRNLRKRRYKYVTIGY